MDSGASEVPPEISMVHFPFENRRTAETGRGGGTGLVRAWLDWDMEFQRVEELGLCRIVFSFAEEGEVSVPAGTYCPDMAFMRIVRHGGMVWCLVARDEGRL